MADLENSRDFDAVDLARRICATRRRRARYLPENLLGEPAWDILLDLLVSEADGREVAINSACIASGVPTSTATRCIKSLVDKGLIVQRRHGSDGRRRILTLTRDGRDSIREALNDAHKVLNSSCRAVLRSEVVLLL